MPSSCWIPVVLFSRRAKLRPVCLGNISTPCNYETEVIIFRMPLPPFKEAHGKICKHLKLWQLLAAECLSRNWKCFRCKPKLHYLLHLSRHMRRTKLNLMVIGAVWSEESFLGKLKRVGIKCHAANLMSRLYARILLLLSLRFRRSRE